MYQTVIKNEFGSMSISYHRTKISAADRKVLEKYKIFVVTNKKMK